LTGGPIDTLIGGRREHLGMQASKPGDDEPIECLFCSRPAPVLGIIGRRIHYRCSECGKEFSLEREGAEATMRPLDAVTAHDGLRYEVVHEEVIAPPRGDRVLVSLILESPNGTILPITAIRNADGEPGPVLCCSDWMDEPGPETWEDVPGCTWCEIETGAPAVIVDGLPRTHRP
jgi:hypothetical protein